MHPAQENASKPEGLPPNQGGKYVGFGSGGSAPPLRRGHGGGGLDDVSVALSKGFSHLSTAAGELLSQSSLFLRILARQLSVVIVVEPSGRQELELIRVLRVATQSNGSAGMLCKGPQAFRFTSIKKGSQEVPYLEGYLEDRLAP